MHKTRPHTRMAPSFLGMDARSNDLTTDRSVNSQATWVIDVLGLFFDMLSMGYYTTRLWQTFTRIMQESDIHD